MAVLSADLAHKDYGDIGTVVLRWHVDHVCGELVDLPLQGEPSPKQLAEFLNRYCLEREIRILLLDGPQGWKANDSELAHSRRCERALNTPAKTGLPPSVKPANYRDF